MEKSLKDVIADYEFANKIRMHNFNEGNITLDQYKEEIKKLKEKYEDDIKKVLFYNSI